LRVEPSLNVSTIDEPTVVRAIRAGLAREGAGIDVNEADLNVTLGAGGLPGATTSSSSSSLELQPASSAAMLTPPSGSIGAPPSIFRRRRRLACVVSCIVVSCGEGSMPRGFAAACTHARQTAFKLDDSASFAS